MLISFPVMADELVESQSLPQAISELASATNDQTLDQRTSRRLGLSREQISGRSSLPPGVSLARNVQHFNSERHIEHVKYVKPSNDYQKDKPQYQSVTVLESTIPEIPEGSVLKSNTHGVVFFFNGCWLALSSATDYFLNEFGEIMEKDSYQWILSNFIDGITPDRGTSGPIGRMRYQTYSGTSIDVWETDCTSERYPVNEPMVYPLRLTNDLYVIKFAAPQELAAPKKEKLTKWW